MTDPMTPVAATDPIGIVFLIGYVLLIALGARVTSLARGLRRGSPRSQSILWDYLTFAGVIALLTGAVGVVDVVVIELGVIAALWLAIQLIVALAMREGYFNARRGDAETDRRDRLSGRGLLELLFVALIVVVAFGLLFEVGTWVLVLAAVTAVAIAGYGLYYQLRRTREATTRGTLIDTLLRHLSPVLVFAGGPVVALALGILPITEHVAVAVAATFVVLTAGLLIPVTVKLHQHLLTQR